MDQVSPNWIGPIGLFIWALIMFWGVHQFHKRQRRYIDAIGRLTGYRVEWLRDSPLGLPNIYIEGSRAKRLQKTYVRAICRHSIALIVVAIVWMLFGGWLLVTLANLFLAIFPGWMHHLK